MVGAFLRRHRFVLGGLVVAVAYYPRFVRPGGMELYRHGAQCVLTQQVLQSCDLLYTYPPAFAFVMIPFVPLPLWLAVAVWYVVTIACTVIACKLSADIALRLFPGPWEARELSWFRFVGVLLSLKFILAVFEDQAFDLLILPLVLYGILALAQRRNMTAAVSLALAAAMKVTPLIFLPWLIFKKRFAAAGVFVAVLVLVSFLPDVFFTPNGGAHGYFVTWVRDIAGASIAEDPTRTALPFWDGANMFNLSLRGALARLVDHTSWQESFTRILRVVQVTFAGAIGVLMLLSNRCRALIPVEGSLLIIAALMLAPMTGRGHFVGLVLPYFLLTAAWLKDTHSKRLGTIVLLVSFVLCTGIPRDLVPHGYEDFMRRANDIMFGTLVLVVYLAVIILRPDRWKIGCAETGVSFRAAGADFPRAAR